MRIVRASCAPFDLSFVVHRLSLLLYKALHYRGMDFVIPAPHWQNSVESPHSGPLGLGRKD